MANATNYVAAVSALTGAGTGVVNFLTTPSSANLATALTTKTGTGANVFGTSPNFTTSVTTDSTSFSVFDTTAVTVNAFGGATTLNIGSNTATINFGASGRSLLVSGQLELGRNDGQASSPYVDFHSGATLCDFDSRIIATGGTGTSGNGNLTFIGSSIYCNASSLATDKTTLNIFESVVTTAYLLGAATNSRLGYSGTSTSTTNLSTGSVGSGNTKNLNLGTGGQAGSTTNVIIGSDYGTTSSVMTKGTFLVTNTGYTPNIFSLAGCAIIWNKDANSSGSTYFQNFRQGGSGGFVFELYDTNSTTPVLLSTPIKIDGSGNTTFSGYIVSTNSTAGIGSASGAGGTVTQATSKSTAVTINKISGEITMNGASLAAAASVSFTLNNSTIALQDVVKVTTQGGLTSTYSAISYALQSGSCVIKVTNEGTTQSEAVKINFTVIKGTKT